MQKIRAVVAAALLALAPFSAVPGRTTLAAVQGGNNVLGDVVAVDASSKQIFVKTDAGAVVIMLIPREYENAISSRLITWNSATSCPCRAARRSSVSAASSSS